MSNVFSSHCCYYIVLWTFLFKFLLQKSEKQMTLDVWQPCSSGSLLLYPELRIFFHQFFLGEPTLALKNLGAGNKHLFRDCLEVHRWRRCFAFWVSFAYFHSCRCEKCPERPLCSRGLPVVRYLPQEPLGTQFRPFSCRNKHFFYLGYLYLSSFLLLFLKLNLNNCIQFAHVEYS